VSKRTFRRNTATQDARINAGINADPENRELTVKDFAEAVPFAKMMKHRGRRPKAARQWQGR